MEKVNKKVIAIALALSLITAVLIYVYISGIKSEVPQVEYATVYVASRTLPARSRITADDIKQVKIAKELSNEKAVNDISEIIGKRLKDRIIEGEQIRIERIADENNVSLSYSIPDGTRAVSINVNEQINVANLLRPGDFVDVIGSFGKEETNNGETIRVYPRMTKIILQNVQVLALGQDMELSPGKLNELPTTVTLAVKKEDIEKFIYSSEYSSLRLALRSFDDKSITNTQGVIREDMTGTKGVYSVPGAVSREVNGE